MDWEGDTSDDNSADDCSEDEVRIRPGHSFFFVRMCMCLCCVVFFFFSLPLFFVMPDRVGSVFSVF